VWLTVPNTTLGTASGIELNLWRRKTKWSASTRYKLCVFCRASPLLPCTYTHRHQQGCHCTLLAVKITSWLRALFWRLSVNSAVKDTLHTLNTANTAQEHWRAAGWSSVISVKHSPFGKAGGLRTQLENFGQQCFHKRHNRHIGQDLTRVTWFYTMSFSQENYKINYLVPKADSCIDNIFISRWWSAAFTINSNAMWKCKV
jgi:hypothetical protein